jgi:hypothetical protein
MTASTPIEPGTVRITLTFPYDLTVTVPAWWYASFKRDGYDDAVIAYKWARIVAEYGRDARR